MAIGGFPIAPYNTGTMGTFRIFVSRTEYFNIFIIENSGIIPPVTISAYGFQTF